MITLKLIIYSLILFILLVKIPSCENNIVDLINIILVIILFNLILEKVINTNIQENYDPINNNNYSFIEKPNVNNTYDYEEVNTESKINTESETIETDTESETNTDTEIDTDKVESSSNNSNDTINDQIKEKTNEIVNVIKDNVKTMTTNFNNILKERESEPELNNKFIYGYSYLHTDNWSIPEKRNPVCKNPKPCKICPHKTDGFNPYLLNYNTTYNENKK